jgi:hypothetical protein
MMVIFGFGLSKLGYFEFSQSVNLVHT